MPPPAPAPWRLSGQVGNTATGERIGAASVTVAGQTVRTDAEGRFTLEAPSGPAEAHLVTVRGDGLLERAVWLRPHTAAREVETIGQITGAVVPALTGGVYQAGAIEWGPVDRVEVGWIQFAMDTWRAPKRILSVQPTDQLAHVLRNRWPARPPAASLPLPKQPKALAMPRDDGGRLNDDEC